VIKKVLPFIFVFVLAIFLAGVYLVNQFGPSGGGEKIFVINKGESLSSIARRLEKEDIIKNNLAFLVFLKFSGEDKNIQAGSFRLSGEDGFEQIVKKLQVGRIDLWATILEGWRREQIAIELENELGISASEFFSLTHDKEGYLFPDTYLFPYDASAQTAVNILTNNFEKKWGQIRQEAQDQGLTKEEVVIMASLLEREAKTDDSRQMVAGILLKRLKTPGWLLQVDAGAQYVKDSANCVNGNWVDSSCDWWQPVTRSDLQIDSVFNTYVHSGLPPSPICNPSLSSLSAVVNAKKSDYWFYITGNDNLMHYAKTIEEHNANINRYLR